MIADCFMNPAVDCSIDTASAEGIPQKIPFQTHWKVVSRLFKKDLEHSYNTIHIQEYKC